MTKIDVHKFGERFEREKETLIQSNIGEHNKKAIMDFLKHCQAQECGNARLLKYASFLRLFCQRLSQQGINKDFENITKDDLIDVFQKIKKEDYSEWTIHDDKVIVKRFYKWLEGNEQTYPEKVKWISTTIKQNGRHLPEELLTEDDILKLINSTQYIRDKALISFLYESGCRIGELLNMNIRNISFDQQFARAIVDGKTGQRRIPLLSCSPHLTQWLNAHPARDNPNAPLWVNLENPFLQGSGGKKHTVKQKTVIGKERMSPNSVRAMLQRTFQRAKVRKKFNPHLFRHSRASFLAKYMTEAQLREYFGWEWGSDTPSLYVHLSGRDMDTAIRTLHGIETEEEKEKTKLKPINCPRCSKTNPSANKFCYQCGAILDIKIALELENKQKDEKDILHMFIQKVVEKNPEQAETILKDFPKEMLEKLQSL